MPNRVGQQLGNYRLLRLLGKGGFAEVYLGEHIYLTTQAAIKVLLANLGSQTDVEGFRREAETIAKLTHPHIVRVLDFDVEQGVPFLIMEYAPSGSLRTRHPRGQPLPLPQILPYVQQVASALQYAHQHKLIHRDVKPDNMLLRDEGTVVLSDFGIVTIAHSTSSRNVEAMAGSPAYMAPEQMQGEPRPASDQYALAVTVYEWITGHLPFRGTAMEVAMQHAMKPPPSLIEQVPTLPSAVEQVILTALAKNPKDRFATVHAFAQALVQAAQPTQAIEVLTHLAVSNSTPPTPPRSGPSIAELPLVMTHLAEAPQVTDSTRVVSPPLPLSEAPAAVEMTPRPLLVEGLRPRRSRKTVLALGSALLALLVVSMSILWTINTIKGSQPLSPPTNAQHPQVTSQAIPTLTAQARSTATKVTSSPEPPASVVPSPAARGSATEAVTIAGNTATEAVTIAGNTASNGLYQMHSDGTIWEYTGGGFHSWRKLDDNPNTAIVVARGSDLYQQHGDHSIWQYAGGGFHSWTKLDDNTSTAEIAAGGSGHLYQRHSDGSIWQYTGGGFHSWTKLDDNPQTSDIEAGESNLYQLHKDGSVWQYAGGGFHSWTKLDDNPGTSTIHASDNGSLYQLHSDHSIWQYTGGGFHSWTKLDDNPGMVSIVAGGNNLYQLHKDGSVWQYAGGGFHSWIELDDNPQTSFLVASESNLYQFHTDKSIWQYAGGGFHSWTKLDDNPQTRLIAAEIGEFG